MNPDDPRHGTVNGYCNLGCRCAACRAAWRVKHRAYLDAHPEQRRKAADRQALEHGRDMRAEREAHLAWLVSTIRPVLVKHGHSTADIEDVVERLRVQIVEYGW